jgi:hypothetical protein
MRIFSDDISLFQEPDFAKGPQGFVSYMVGEILLSNLAVFKFTNLIF